jgi:hypothetical protein
VQSVGGWWAILPRLFRRPRRSAGCRPGPHSVVLLGRVLDGIVVEANVASDWLKQSLGLATDYDEAADNSLT